MGRWRGADMTIDRKIDHEQLEVEFDSHDI